MLIRLGHHGADTEDGHETADRVPLSEGRTAGCSPVRTLEIIAGASSAQVLAPVTNRGEAIGVLELRLPELPDDRTLADIAAAAHAFAYVVIANRRYTDLFEWGQRSVPLTLAAEIQHRLLPASYTLEAGQFTLAGWLEPAGNNAGDTFDFSLERGAGHLSLTDAMGYNLAAALLATVLVGAAQRPPRRPGPAAPGRLRERRPAGPHRPRGVRDRAARAHRPAHRDRRHRQRRPRPPARLRGACRVDRARGRPALRTLPDYFVPVQPLPLEPGDRLLFLTDGMLERNAASLDVPALVAAGADQHRREAVQDLMGAVIAASGKALEDDATALRLDWHGGPERGRNSSGGANR